MPKLDKTLSRLIPPGPVKETLKSAYYNFYYNYKHAKDNGFRIYYKGDRYEYLFPNGIRFECRENIADDLQRSVPGYVAKYRIQEGDVVVDCGAYIGEFTLYAARAVGAAGKVVAFEPDPVFFKKLEENILLNDLHNVILVEKGVWSEEGKLNLSGGSQGGNFFAENLNYNTRSSNVSVTTIDAELKRRGMTKVNFLKMDVEGAEIEAVKGAGCLLKQGNIHLAVASYHVVNGQKTCVDLERVLKALGYETETSYPVHLTTYAQKIAGGV